MSVSNHRLSEKEMEMTEISHFLEPGGWKITRTAEGECATMFPKSGRILIGRGEAKGECCLVWLDGTQCLRIVQRLQRQKGSSDWMGTFTQGGKQYWITVKATAVKAGMRKARRKRIEGQIGTLDGSASQASPIEYSPTGTWGAEAGGGGGGGGGNAPLPPTKGKPNGSDANAH